MHDLHHYIVYQEQIKFNQFDIQTYVCIYIT